jgi:hypothetical protein
MNPKLLPVSTVAFTIIYMLGFYLRARVLVYYPENRLWRWTVDLSQPQPGMYYYGWLTIGAIGAAIVALAAAPFIGRIRWRPSAAWTWVLPLVAMPFLAIIYGYRFNLW